MHVCWILAQKIDQTESQQKSQFSIQSLLDKVDFEHAGHGEVVLRTVQPKQGNDWQKVYPHTKGKGPRMDKVNGNKFFPFIKVKLSTMAFKVYFFCLLLHLFKVMTSKYPNTASAALQLRNEHYGSTHDTATSTSCS